MMAASSTEVFVANGVRAGHVLTAPSPGDGGNEARPPRFTSK